MNIELGHIIISAFMFGGLAWMIYCQGRLDGHRKTTRIDAKIFKIYHDIIVELLGTEEADRRMRNATLMATAMEDPEPKEEI